MHNEQHLYGVWAYSMLLSSRVSPSTVQREAIVVARLMNDGMENLLKVIYIKTFNNRTLLTIWKGEI